ncbi:hypothetical protein E4U45_001584 [Claviceps purpurea]|nr:hypothetical protein E4U45_001584 [Claviceps purpurea]
MVFCKPGQCSKRGLARGLEAHSSSILSPGLGSVRKGELVGRKVRGALEGENRKHRTHSSFSPRNLKYIGAFAVHLRGEMILESNGHERDQDRK